MENVIRTFLDEVTNTSGGIFMPDINTAVVFVSQDAASASSKALIKGKEFNLLPVLKKVQKKFQKYIPAKSTKFGDFPVNKGADFTIEELAVAYFDFKKESNTGSKYEKPKDIFMSMWGFSSLSTNIRKLLKW